MGLHRVTGENARCWEALGEARPGQSSLSAGALRHRAWALPRGVRPRLEGKPRTPLSSRVATRVSWSPLHERLPEILVVPREKTPTGAAARGNP